MTRLGDNSEISLWGPLQQATLYKWHLTITPELLLQGGGRSYRSNILDDSSRCHNRLGKELQNLQGLEHSTDKSERLSSLHCCCCWILATLAWPDDDNRQSPRSNTTCSNHVMGHLPCHHYCRLLALPLFYDSLQSLSSAQMLWFDHFQAVHSKTFCHNRRGHCSGKSDPHFEHKHWCAQPGWKNPSSSPWLHTVRSWLQHAQ